MHREVIEEKREVIQRPKEIYERPIPGVEPWNTLQEELVFKIFGYLSPIDLCRISAGKSSSHFSSLFSVADTSVSAELRK